MKGEQTIEHVYVLVENLIYIPKVSHVFILNERLKEINITQTFPLTHPQNTNQN